MDTTSSTIDDILENVPRFRILSVGRAGVGKSSLINCVFGITEAKVSEYVVGEATIGQELVSSENERFVLHDSKGFEAGNDQTLDLAFQFLRERRDKEKPLKDQLHAIWLCVETPRAGDRVLEKGDESLLKLAHELDTPVVVVFTKYDRLVWSKKKEAMGQYKNATNETLREKSMANAEKTFEESVDLLNKSTDRLSIPRTPCLNISVKDGYRESIEKLVNTTRKLVQEHLEGDAWMIWAIAQRTSLPMKIEACVDKGVNYYYRALAAGVGGKLLWQCLAQVHRDIVTCWNFKDDKKILDGTEFQQLIFYLIEELHTGSSESTVSPPSLDRISHFVTLVTASAIPMAAPPAAILGLTYFFVKWVSDAVVKHLPEVERLLMAYTVDLVSVLRLLFDFALQPRLAGRIDWGDLTEAFQEYEFSNQRKNNHAYCRSLFKANNVTLSKDSFRKEIKRLLDGR